MDIYSRKRVVGLSSSPTKGSTSATRDNVGSREEPIQLCNRIGCSGRLNHAQHAFNYLRPSSGSSNIHTKKHDSNSSERSQVKLKSKSRDTKSNKGVLNMEPVGRAVEAGPSRVRKVHGLANRDGQSGSFDRGRKEDTVKKKTNEGETSSSARGNRISQRLLDGESGSLSSFRSSISGSRHSRSWNACRGSGVSSVRTRRSVSQHGNESPVQSSRETMDNVDTIANMLLALERIDQEEGLTYEQIMGNPFLGGLNLFDQHRDMRLDIDNMSYEELLALEEEMGIVSTAVSEEELSKCVRISIYKPLCMMECRMRDDRCLDDTKCSICQEEFISGDEIGRVGCDHGYHALCINQWLRLKNWCPICKASVKP
uniref:E3 ubiquitin-protein ligase MBR1-like n=1 Tax=Erigeron canadensis TaxID=72917 RepID=UPI001CB92A1A|nr:E3 ubiquitin-protein ligase MBR1-like [Erigeron canadensis]XP_043613174.1 E3 ubiquitin-protein ligase MBR1-like [Erigeron canadensis]